MGFISAVGLIAFVTFLTSLFLLIYRYIVADYLASAMLIFIATWVLFTLSYGKGRSKNEDNN
jgi:hypothetical protein